MRPSLGEEPSEAGEDRRGCGGELVCSQNNGLYKQFRRKLLFIPPGMEGHGSRTYVSR